MRHLSAEWGITILDPTSASGIIVLLKTPKELQYVRSMTLLADFYTYHIPIIYDLVPYPLKQSKLRNAQLLVRGMHAGNQVMD